MQEKQIGELQKLVFRQEHLENEVFLSSEMNIDKEKPCFFLLYENDELVCFLDAFFPSSREIEFNGFTHPSYQRRGYFTALVNEALKTYQGMPFTQALFQCELNSKSGKAYLQKRYPLLDRSEYVMALARTDWANRPAKGTLRKLDKKSLPEALAIACEAYGMDPTAGEQELEFLISEPEREVYLYLLDGQVIGMLNVHHESEERVMLHAVAIRSSDRGKGYGRAMMCLALEEVFRTVDTLLLEVDSENPPALALYRSLGFRVCSQVDYHRLIL
ncbi:MAG: GNAT family N-acetyltransferase [Sphaerochaeta sp.]|nr:GNAT family N-acetyltransferase [Sphaerochaeta sp.]